MAKIIECPQDVKLKDIEGLDIPFKKFLITQLDSYIEIKTPSQLRQANKVIDAIEAANGAINLEDADFDLLKAACAKSTFVPRIARQLIPYWDALDKVQDVKK